MERAAERKRHRLRAVPRTHQHFPLARQQVQPGREDRGAAACLHHERRAGARGGFADRFHEVVRVHGTHAEHLGGVSAPRERIAPDDACSNIYEQRPREDSDGS